MGRPYSNDLRERVVKAVIKGGLSRHEAAAQIWRGHQYGDQLGTALSRDRQRRAGPLPNTVAPADNSTPRPIRGGFTAYRDALGVTAELGDVPLGPSHCGLLIHQGLVGGGVIGGLRTPTASGKAEDAETLGRRASRIAATVNEEIYRQVRSALSSPSA